VSDRGGRRPGAGHPRTLTPRLVAAIARRRELGQSHRQISRELKIEEGTSRYASWLARHASSIPGGARTERRLQSKNGPPPGGRASEAVST
jgi:hypothetical protein